MADLFESGFFGSNKPAWHGLGTVVEGLLNAEDCIREAGLDWNVTKRPLFVSDDDDVFDSIDGYYAITRDTDMKTLGVVGKNYLPLQNSESFTFFDSVVSRKEAIYETAGSLDGGKKIWLLAKLPEEITFKGEEIKKYLLLHNTHDGSGSVIIKLSPVRVVCANTLAIALRGGGYTIRHTASMHDRIEQAANAMGFANKMYAELEDSYRAMFDKKMKQGDIISYLNRCLKKSEKSKNHEMSETEFLGDNESEERDTKLRVTITRLLEEGAGTDLPGVKGSLWGAYNAITEAVDHHRSYRTPDARFKNAAFEGSGQILKVKAFEEAKRLIRV